MSPSNFCLLNLFSQNCQTSLPSKAIKPSFVEMLFSINRNSTMTFYRS
jgi:hypothetical protein